VELVIIGSIPVLLAVYAVRAARSHSTVPLREAGRGLLAGLAGGILWAVAARLAMRIVAVIDGGGTSFSVGGTIVVLLAGVLIGMPLALLFALLRRRLPTSTVSSGLIAGAILALLLTPPIMLLGGEVLDNGLLTAPVLTAIALFAGLFFLFGITIAQTYDHVTAGSSAPSPTPAHRRAGLAR